jgi:hypothetical protein
VVTHDFFCLSNYSLLIYSFVFFFSSYLQMSANVELDDAARKAIHEKSAVSVILKVINFFSVF